MMQRLPTLALAFFAAAAAWPWVVGSMAYALMSPLERTLQSAWCGMPLHSSSDVLGHCAACWAGSALLATMGALLLWRGARAPSLAGMRVLLPAR